MFSRVGNASVCVGSYRTLVEHCWIIFNYYLKEWVKTTFLNVLYILFVHIRSWYHHWMTAFYHFKLKTCGGEIYNDVKSTTTFVLTGDFWPLASWGGFKSYLSLFRNVTHFLFNNIPGNNCCLQVKSQQLSDCLALLTCLTPIHISF